MQLPKLVYTNDGRPLYSFVSGVMSALGGVRTDFEVKMEGGHILRFTLQRKKKPWWHLWRNKKRKAASMKG